LNYVFRNDVMLNAKIQLNFNLKPVIFKANNFV